MLPSSDGGGGARGAKDRCCMAPTASEVRRTGPEPSARRAAPVSVAKPIWTVISETSSSAAQDKGAEGGGAKTTGEEAGCGGEGSAGEAGTGNGWRGGKAGGRVGAGEAAGGSAGYANGSDAVLTLSTAELPSSRYRCSSQRSSQLSAHPRKDEPLTRRLTYRPPPPDASCDTMYARSCAEPCSTLAGTEVMLPARMNEWLISVALGAASSTPA